MSTAGDWLVLWTCLCSDAAADVDTLPERCPQHDRARAVPLVRNPLPKPMATGHRCNDTTGYNTEADMEEVA